MANSLAVNRYTPPGTPDTVELAVTPSGDYVTDGDALNLDPSTFEDPNGIGVLGQPLNVPVGKVTVDVENADGYYAQIVPAATLAAFKLLWFSTEGTQLAAGAYPAAITGAQIVIRLPLY